MFNFFKKKNKEQEEREKLEKEIRNSEEELKNIKNELQDIFEYVHSHHDKEFNKISLKPQDYKNYYNHISDPIEKTEVMVLDYIGELEKKDRTVNYKWSYNGLIDGYCIYNISTSKKYSLTENFSLKDINSALYSNEKDYTGKPINSNKYEILVIPHYIPINNLGFNRELNEEETEQAIRSFYDEENEFDYIKGDLELFEKNGIKYHRYLISYKSELQSLEQKNFKKRSRHISQNVKDKVWRRDGGKCVECGSQERLEFDHIIPHSKGGSNTYRNIQLLCEHCNRSKSAKIG